MAWFEARPFPEQAWTEELKEAAHQPLIYLPKDWRTRISLAGPDLSNVEKDCRDVLEAKRDRTVQRDSIERQAVDAYAAIAPVQALIGPLLPQQSPPSTAELVQAVLWDSVPVTFSFKVQFNRGRPYHCCDLPLEPMFQRPSSLYPGHPSYPSGHSTQAHLVAELYSRMFPALKARLYQAADGVARNREIAGLHFPTDSAAGARLAVLLIDEFLAVRPLRSLYEQARLEWPHLQSLQ